MRAFYSDTFQFPLPEGHHFPVAKYSLLRERLLSEGILHNHELTVPDPASDEQLRLVHEASYVERVVNGRLTEKEIRRIGFPWSPELVERSRRSAGGTIAACRSALQEGVAANLAGGTHHAHPEFGAGFCVFNDVAVASRVVQQDHAARRVVILDCDVHQGDGTAAIFQGDSSVYTFSIHGAGNFPFHKQQSDLDIALPDDTGDESYLSALESGLARALNEAEADLAVYLAGADPYEDDRFGRLKLSKAGLASRDRLVVQHCRDMGLPLAAVMSGGYARSINDIVDVHLQTLRILASIATWNYSNRLNPAFRNRSKTSA
jgi:acetoin utilization deacetylase AcuC-like enzyme